MGNSRRRSARTGDRDRESGIRQLRLQELIREEVNQLLRNEIRDERLTSVIVTMVDLSRDGSCARIWFSNENEEGEEALERAAGFLRSRLAEALDLKRTPELRFRRDRATLTLTEEFFDVHEESGPHRDRGRAWPWFPPPRAAPSATEASRRAAASRVRARALVGRAPRG
jgi:ribosome-binding factor A